MVSASAVRLTTIGTVDPSATLPTDGITRSVGVGAGVSGSIAIVGITEMFACESTVGWSAATSGNACTCRSCWAETPAVQRHAQAAAARSTRVHIWHGHGRRGPGRGGDR